MAKHLNLSRYNNVIYSIPQENSSLASYCYRRCERWAATGATKIQQFFLKLGETWISSYLWHLWFVIILTRDNYTRCVRKVSDLRLYIRARALERPLRSMSVTSSPSRAFSVRRICLQLEMTERTDQRICIKFRFNLDKSCTETIEMIQKAFVDESMIITQIK